MKKAIALALLTLGFASPAFAAVTVTNVNVGVVHTVTIASSNTGGNVVSSGGTIVTGAATAIATSSVICSRSCDVRNIVLRFAR